MLLDMVHVLERHTVAMCVHDLRTLDISWGFSHIHIRCWTAL